MRRTKINTAKLVSVPSSSSANLIQFLAHNEEFLEQFSHMLGKAQSEYGLCADDLLYLVKNRQEIICLPLSIFENELAPLEAVAQFLKEEGYKIIEIANLMKRSNKTIWTVLEKAKKKDVTLVKKSEYYIPVEYLSNRKISTLEAVSIYCHDKLHLRFSDIGRRTLRSRNTIWTSYQRGKKKLS